MLLEQLARLNAKTCNLLSAGGGKANGSLSPEDVAAALAGVKHPIGSLLLRTKYSGNGIKDLIRTWGAHVVEEAKKEGWKTKKPGIYSLIAESTLEEFLDCRCKHCEGRGIQRKTLKAMQRLAVVKPQIKSLPLILDGAYLVIDCDFCQGTGQGKPNHSQRARQLGIKPNSYEETWHAKFEKLLLDLSVIERESVDQFAKQMKR
jgi:hypothetical protein